MSKPPLPNMDELFQRLLDDQICPDEMERLQEAMLDNPQVQDYYLDSIFAYAAMRRYSQVTAATVLSESDLIQVLSGDAGQGRLKRFVPYLYAFAAILILGMVIFMSLTFFRHRTSGPAIGLLTGVYEAQWQGSHPRPGESMFTGPYKLREGAAQVKLGQGTSLLLEAPCQFELTSVDEIFLKSGRLTAMVSAEAKGFRVRTPTALITDLGTEFGVIAHANESTEAHVLKGQISMALDPNRSGGAASLVLNEGQAAAVDAAGRTVRDRPAARADLFLLQLPRHSQHAPASERINLADIVGGGSGRGTGTLEQGIDLRNGQTFKGPAAAIRWARQNEFLSTPKFRSLDGVFVPNGALGPTVISTTGLRFSLFPETRGSYYGGPANSGKFYDLLSQQIYTARLNGIPFGTSRHPALSLHPNAGITFDLDQIRQDNSNIRFDRFTAVCGIPKNLPQPQFSPADVWILLDGVVSLHLRYPTGRSVIENVDVSIPARIRFLTLAATCSGRADFSWIFFGDPFLERTMAVREETGL